VSGPNVYDYATSLVDEGYLRIVDQEAGDYGETTFGVTEAGMPVAKAAATSVTFADVDVRLDRQQAQIDQLQSQVEQLREDLEDLAVRHDGLIDTIEESDVL
jgi:TolA-binding protein